MANQKRRKHGKKVIKWQTLAIIIGIITLILVTLCGAWRNSIPPEITMSYKDFELHVKDGDIASVNITSSQKYFTVELEDGGQYTVVNPGNDEFIKDLLEAGVNVRIQRSTLFESISDVILSIPMMILLFVILYYLIKTLGGQTTTLYKLYKADETVTFDDVAGMSEAKEEVKFAVSQITNAKRLKELGARPCKGILLEGPPGTGKTLLAKAIAGEAGVPFISTSGSDFVEMFVGLGAARVRALWDLAKTNAPCVLFIDEIDAVGKRRRSGGDGATTEGNQTLNELLSQMDGLATNMGIFVVGATNRIDDLDPALVRPGRFDTKIFIGPPKTKKDRDEIIKLYLKNKSLSDDINFDSVSKLMFGFSGAEIEQVLNEAVLMSIQRGGDGIVSLNDIDAATMKLRTSGVVVKHSSQEDIHTSAVHEAGHAVVNVLLGRKVSKVSITPYNSGVGGVTVRDVDDVDDKKTLTKTEITNEILVLLAGRMAEKVIIGDTSTGCSNDIERATILAYSMIYRFAMDDTKLINPDSLAKTDTTILANDNRLEVVNDLLLEFNTTMEDLITNNIERVTDLAGRLEEEENVYNYSFEIE